MWSCRRQVEQATLKSTSQGTGKTPDDGGNVLANERRGPSHHAVPALWGHHVGGCSFTRRFAVAPQTLPCGDRGVSRETVLYKGRF